jgi:hypothetical protein
LLKNGEAVPVGVHTATQTLRDKCGPSLCNVKVVTVGGQTICHIDVTPPGGPTGDNSLVVYPNGTITIDGYDDSDQPCPSTGSPPVPSVTPSPSTSDPLPPSSGTGPSAPPSTPQTEESPATPDAAAS